MTHPTDTWEMNDPHAGRGGAEGEGEAAGEVRLSDQQSDTGTPATQVHGVDTQLPQAKH